ncbi:MAG: adenylate/guanylate cyclase domain-containing protein [Thermodesulfobacteriota bacterium]|jgi:class 3 adenylate cyclase
MRCASCGYENPGDAKFCEECGAKLGSTCPQCGHAVRPGAKFCRACGAALSEPLRPPAPIQSGTTSAPDAERRQLTVLFCDLVDSTALAAQLDPEEWREVVRAYQEACTTVIQRYEGHIAQHLGDGLLVYFGHPLAHEDDAQLAVRTALDIIAILPSAPLLQAHEVQVRLGIHTGQVVVGEVGAGGKREQLALGDTPHIAARLQGLAAPNTVLISAATQRLITGLFECRDEGLQSLKGVSAPKDCLCLRFM